MAREIKIIVTEVFYEDKIDVYCGVKQKKFVHRQSSEGVQKPKGANGIEMLYSPELRDAIEEGKHVPPGKRHEYKHLPAIFYYYELQGKRFEGKEE